MLGARIVALAGRKALVGTRVRGTTQAVSRMGNPIRVVNAATGELVRELTLDPSRDYQPTGAPKGPKRKPPT